jgi:hypothetical protein
MYFLLPLKAPARGSLDQGTEYFRPLPGERLQTQPDSNSAKKKREDFLVEITERIKRTGIRAKRDLSFQKRKKSLPHLVFTSAKPYHVLRCAEKRLFYPGIELLLKERKQAVPDPVAGMVIIDVGEVLTPWNAMVLQELPKEILGKSEQRAKKMRPALRNADKPPDTGSTHEVHKKRFGRIIGSMGNGHSPPAAGDPDALEKIVPDSPGAVFQGFSPPKKLRNRTKPAHQGTTQAFGHFGDKQLVLSRVLSPDAVVEMGDDHPPLPEKVKHPQESHGIASSRYGQHDRIFCVPPALPHSDILQYFF